MQVSEQFPKIAQDYQQNPTEIGKVMMTWAQGFMSGANAALGKDQYRDLAAMTILRVRIQPQTMNAVTIVQKIPSCICCIVVFSVA